MENKKELISLNSKLYSSLSLEDLEEKMELGCWIYCFFDGTDFCAFDSSIPPSNCSLNSCSINSSGGSTE